MTARSVAPAGLVAAGLLLLGLTAFGAHALSRWEHGWVVYATLVQAIVYAGAASLLLRGGVSGRRAVIAILGVGLAMRAMVLFMPPVSTDIFRYVWDGRVQAAGINPYLYVPADPALAHLRDADVYPHINRKEYAPTIYPPTAQLVFRAVAAVGGSVTAMKAAMVAFEGLCVWAILNLLAARGLPQTRVLLYVWHPLPIYEFAGSGHVDAIAIGLLMAAFWAADRRHPILAGAALAAGALSKYFPVVAGPALWRPWDWRLPAGFIGTAILLYLPYLSAGTALTGFLGGYVAEEGLASGDGFFPWLVLRLVLPQGASASTIYLPAVVALLAVLALRTTFSSDPKPDLRAAFVLALAFTILFSPHHAWYFAWLIPFLCFHPSPAVIFITSASSAILISGWATDAVEGSFIYGSFALLLLIELLVRRSRTMERHDGSAWAREPAR